MHRPLRQIADISIGLTLRGPEAARRIQGEGAPLLRISDLTLDGQVLIGSPKLIDIDPTTESQYLVRPGDIVMANRGTRATTAVIPDDLNAVAGNQMFIIRVDPNLSDPEFISWYLNLDTIQDLLGSKARGTYIKTLSVKVVRDLEVPVPPLDKIRVFKELNRVTIVEKEKMNRIADLRQKMLRAALHKLA